MAEAARRQIVREAIAWAWALPDGHIRLVTLHSARGVGAKRAILFGTVASTIAYELDDTTTSST
jgi:hypothetical protein